MGIFKSLSLVILIGIAAVGSTINSVRATTVIYDESVSGDITTASPPTFALAIGTNIISGSLNISIADGFFDRLDPFGISLGIGQELTSASLQFTGFTITAGTVGFDRFSGQLFGPGFVGFIGDTDSIFGFGSPTTSLFGVLFPITAPLLTIKVKHQQLTSTPTADASFAYNVLLEVDQIAVIPLPAALPLYGTGLAVMGFLGWRRKRSALRN